MTNYIFELSQRHLNISSTFIISSFFSSKLSIKARACSIRSRSEIEEENFPEIAKDTLEKIHIKNKDSKTRKRVSGSRARTKGTSRKKVNYSKKEQRER